MALDPTAELGDLLQALVDIESVSGDEGRLCDEIEQVLRACPHLGVTRDQDALVAKTDLGRANRVAVAGHIDTVPVAGNLPSRRQGGVVYGRGSADMKGGIAVMLSLAAALDHPKHDVTWIFYDHEEVEADKNGLGRLSPADLAADLAVLMEPTNALIEGGCQGTLRCEIETRGVAAHSARAWLGHNAIHDAFDVLARLHRYQPREVDVEGLTYREGLNAVGISGGVAGNVIPDSCVTTVNFRFAPDRDEASAKDFVEEFFPGYEPRFTDFAAGAKPGLDGRLAREFAAAVGGPVSPKFGWTDVARFSAMGIPALNYGPGDPGKAHKDDECCPVDQLEACRRGLAGYLG
ncbi:MAG: succinyl-diaminopimelate desuccinylase [Propionibacteriaceae bacterium]|jgi:succinyl-diaminopimelate desuccinylase|nr:succinyl-diaminopimelate desuccinylase [Propionibacteriaceae bacterium]